MTQKLSPKLNNQKVGVTGLLVYTPSHFLQVLGGEEEAVRALKFLGDTSFELDSFHLE